MRTQLSLVAIVAALLAGQATAYTFSETKVFKEHPEANKTNAVVLSKCDQEGAGPADIALALSGAEDKSLAVCNGRTVGDLLALNDVSIDSCSTQALKERLDYCDTLVNNNSYACKNARHYCRQGLENIVEYCLRRSDQVLEKNVAGAAFMSALKEANSMNNLSHRLGESFIGRWLNYKSDLEKFIAEY